MIMGTLTRFKPRSAVSYSFITTVFFGFLICLSTIIRQENYQKWSAARREQQYTMALPENIRTLQINIGPNLQPLLPSGDKSDAVLAIEANLAVASRLRELYQKKFPNTFFLINSAVGGAPLAGNFGQFYYYNVNGVSSSLSKAIMNQTWSDTNRFSPEGNYGPGQGGFDFVNVVSLDTVLRAVPSRIKISFLKIDTQGHDFAIICSASTDQLLRIDKIMSETYFNGMGKTRYQGVSNGLMEDWVPYMKNVGFKLSNPPKNNVTREYDAIWIRQNVYD